MEIKSFGNMTTLKGYIDDCAVPTYFTRSEVVDSTLKCYVGENVAVEITSTTFKTYYNSGTSSYTVTYSSFNSICITDNAIVLRNTYYAPSVVICKNDSDDTVVLFFASYDERLVNQSMVSNFNSSITIYRLVVITCMKSILVKGTVARRDDAYTTLHCDSIFNADGVIKNVWLSFFTPFPSQNTPFRYTINTVGYVGTGCNDFVIKSN